MRFRRSVSLIGLAALAGGFLSLAPPVAAAQAPAPLIIKVDAVDPDNQQPFPPFNRLYEYTDFFSRSITVHQGDTINFQTQPFSFHIVTLARDEDAARRAYPVIELDEETAPGTGLPKIIFGDGNFPVTGGSIHGGGVISKDNGKGPPVCGALQFGLEPCRYRGGDSVEIIGPTVGWGLDQQPTTIDQLVTIDAPPGRYTYFDMLHPGMRGTLTVVPDDQPVTTQAQVDAASARQLAHDRDEARRLEADLDRLVRFVNDATTRRFVPPGKRNFVMVNGAGTASGHVVIDKIFPSEPIDAAPGDRVHLLWLDNHAFHTAGFAPSPFALPSPFGFDCGGGVYMPVPNTFNVPPPPPCLEPGATEPEFIGDPGTSPSGTTLGATGEIVNSGLLVGSSYGASPIAHSWSVTIGPDTQKGPHTVFDTVHPWMTGVVNVT
jgi:hypothetical protein